MITIIHGEDAASSRKHYLTQKTNDSISFDGEKLTLTNLVQIIEGRQLFLEIKKIFIDELLSKRKPGRELEEIVSSLNKYSKDNDIFLWEGKELSKKSLSLFKSAEIKLFKLPQYLFTFLDSVRPASKNNVISFHEALKNTEAELLFFMLIRQFRLLLVVSDHNLKEQIDEVKRLAPWQLTKLKKQSSLFSTEKLLSIYKRLYEIDLGQKTGSLNMTLEQAIDMFLLNI